MRFRLFSVLLALVMIFSSVSFIASASEESNSTCQIVAFEDGSYVEIIIAEKDLRATNSKSGSKTYNYYNSDDVREWKAVLSGTFTYTGSTSTCTSASCTVTTYSSDWYEVSNSTTRSGNTATTKLTMGEKFLGITVAKHNYTITLSCDANGNLS